MPFARIRVLSPRKNSPCRPSFAMMSLTTVGYVRGTSLVCFEVLITRTLLLTLSLTALEQNPITALRPSFFATSSSYLGNFESR